MSIHPKALFMRRWAPGGAGPKTPGQVSPPNFTQRCSCPEAQPLSMSGQIPPEVPKHHLPGTSHKQKSCQAPEEVRWRLSPPVCQLPTQDHPPHVGQSSGGLSGVSVAPAGNAADGRGVSTAHSPILSHRAAPPAPADSGPW